jgi:hypothetical protein
MADKKEENRFNDVNSMMKSWETQIKNLPLKSSQQKRAKELFQELKLTLLETKEPSLAGKFLETIVEAADIKLFTREYDNAFKAVTKLTSLARKLGARKTVNALTTVFSSLQAVEDTAEEEIVG